MLGRLQNVTLDEQRYPDGSLKGALNFPRVCVYVCVFGGQQVWGFHAQTALIASSFFEGAGIALRDSCTDMRFSVLLAKARRIGGVRFLCTRIHVGLFYPIQ